MADFIGETNFMDAELVSAGGGDAVLKLASGKQISASLPEGEDITGTVTAVVRPEHASLTKPKPASILTGTLENVVYFGTDTPLSCGTGHRWYVYRAHAECPRQDR